MEVTIFDCLRDVLFAKKQKYITVNDEQLNLQPYMLQRWCSMYGSSICHILNETTNKWLTATTNKQQFYKLLLTILPQQKYKKVAYLKKNTNSNKDQNHDIKDISISAELSQREVKEALNLLSTIKL